MSTLVMHDGRMDGGRADGNSRAARFIEQMERDGLLGPQEGSKPRSVIKTKD